MFSTFNTWHYTNPMLIKINKFICAFLRIQIIVIVHHIKVIEFSIVPKTQQQKTTTFLSHYIVYSTKIILLQYTSRPMYIMFNLCVIAICIMLTKHVLLLK